MSDDVSTAGKLLSGKENERSSRELSSVTRHSKLKTGATASSAVTDTVVAAKSDETEVHDEFYSDVLARFGIQI